VRKLCHEELEQCSFSHFSIYPTQLSGSNNAEHVVPSLIGLYHVTRHRLEVDCVPRDPTPSGSWTMYHVTRHHLGVGLCATWPDIVCELYCVPRDSTPSASWTVYHVTRHRLELYCVPRDSTPSTSWTVYHVTRHRLWVVLCTTWLDTICELDCIPRDPTGTCWNADGYSFNAPDIPSCCIALCEEGFNP
jgi:hypothetical protein